MANRISTSARNGACNAIVDTIDVGAGTAKLQLRTGARPTNLTDAASGTLLAEFSLPNPCFGASSGGTATANAITAVTGSASGTVGHFRVVDRDANPVLDSDSVGTSGTELVLNTTTIASGADVSITSWTGTQPA